MIIQFEYSLYTQLVKLRKVIPIIIYNRVNYFTDENNIEPCILCFDLDRLKLRWYFMRYIKII